MHIEHSELVSFELWILCHNKPSLTDLSKSSIRDSILYSFLKRVHLHIRGKPIRMAKSSSIILKKNIEKMML